MKYFTRTNFRAPRIYSFTSLFLDNNFGIFAGFVSRISFTERNGTFPHFPRHNKFQNNSSPSRCFLLLIRCLTGVKGLRKNLIFHIKKCGKGFTREKKVCKWRGVAGEFWKRVL